MDKDKKTPKVQIIPPQTELKNRAVNFAKGFDIDLSPDQIADLEQVVQRSSETFVRDIGIELTNTRQFCSTAISDGTKIVQALQRCTELAYSVKALGGTFQYPLMTQIAKSLENFVAERTTANKKQLMVARLHIDALYVILASRVTGFGSSVEQATTVALAKLAERYELPRE